MTMMMRLMPACVCVWLMSMVMVLLMKLYCLVMPNTYVGRTFVGVLVSERTRARRGWVICGPTVIVIIRLLQCTYVSEMERQICNNNITI